MPCQVLTGDFAYLVQFILCLTALLALVLKWKCADTTKRNFHIWALDVSKQACGALVVHFANCGLSNLFASVSTVSDQCAWYFINFFIDTTVGSLLAFIYFRLIQRMIACCCGKCDQLTNVGFYGNPVRYSTWMMQLLVWQVVICLMKGTLAACVYALSDVLSQCAIVLFKPFKDEPQLELVIVMIIVPCIMNMIQFWVFDNILANFFTQRECENTRLINDDASGNSSLQDTNEISAISWRKNHYGNFTDDSFSTDVPIY